MIKECSIELVCDSNEELNDFIMVYKAADYSVYEFGSDERGYFFKARKKKE